MTAVITHPEVLRLDDLPNVYLRLIRQEDAEEMYQTISEDREHLQDFQRWARTATLESIQETVTRNLQKIANDEWLQYRIVIEEQPGKPKIIGQITFYEHAAEKNIANLGFWIIQPYEGRGITSAAARRAIKYGFEEWGLERIQLEIDSSNKRSEHLAEKLGAKLTDRVSPEERDGQVFNDRVWEIINE